MLRGPCPLGTTLRDVCGDLGTKRYTPTGSVYMTPMTPRFPTLPEFGQELKVSRSSLLQRIRIHDILSREGLLIKRYWLVFLMLVEVSFLNSPILFKKVLHSSEMVLIVGKGLKQFYHIKF